MAGYNSLSFAAPDHVTHTIRSVPKFRGLIHATVELHYLFPEAPRLRSSMSHPKLESSENHIASR